MPSRGQQLRAVLRKNLITKRRAWRTTLCELVSPVLMICILVLGYSLSEVEYYPAANYAVRSLDLTDAGLLGPFADLGQSNLSVVDLSAAQELLDGLFAGPVPVPSFDAFVGAQQALSAQITDEVYDELVGSNEYGRTWGNLLTGGSLRFAPDTPLVRGLVDHLNESTLLFSSVPVYVHETETAAVDSLLDSLEERTWALVVVEELPDHGFKTTIRANYTTVPNTNWIVRWVDRGLDYKHTRYFLSGFLTLQAAVDEYLFDVCGLPRAPQAITGLPFPTAEYEQNIFFTAVGTLFGLMLVMATLHPMSKLVKALVEEKETRTKELMRIMGLSLWVLNLSWFLTALVTFTVIAVSVTLLLTSSFITYSDPGAIFLLVGLFCLSEISFAFLVSTLFSRAKLAAIVGPVALFGALLPRWIFFSTNRYEKASSKFVASLLSPTAFAFGADFMADYEYGQVGVSADNWDEGDFSYRDSLTMLWVDFWLYLVLAWYFDKCMPSQHGVALPPWFPFQASYWFPPGPPPSVAAGAGASGWDAAPDGGDVEPVPAEMDARRGLQIRGLTKVYGQDNALTAWLRKHLLGRRRAPKPAVNDLCLTMYTGQVTCLLGHNGAGKTSTIGMLTGLMPPTAGDCRMFGMSMRDDMDQIRGGLLGICPQHNVLFPTLTVLEHVEMFAKFKGVPKERLRAACEARIADVGLSDKMHTQSGALSGGMKRKLSVAIALIGDPKIVFLDEPTSGMDPYSRRATWDLLRREKEGRVLVLTTHFMDEADLLGDRIAIMSHGKLQCCGSSLFLKSKFGVGYTLTMTRDRLSCDAGAVRDVVARHVPEMAPLSSSAGEMAYQLPFAAVARFAALFDELETRREELAIGGYGVSLTSMEEVFLKLAGVGAEDDEADPAGAAQQEEDADDDPDAADEFSALLGCGARPAAAASAVDIELAPASRPPPSGADNGHESALSAAVPDDNASVASSIEPEIRSELGDTVDNGTAPWTLQMKLMLRKRLVCTLRDLKGFFFQVVLPVLLVALVLLILTVDINLSGPELRLDARIYEMTTEVPFTGDDPVELVEVSPSVVVLSPQPRANNSDDLSEFLLDTYNDHEHSERFGAFAINDTIFLNLTYNLAELAALPASALELLGVANVADLIDLSDVDLGITLDDLLAAANDTGVDLDDIDFDLGLNITIDDDTTVGDLVDALDANATDVTTDDLLAALNGTALEDTLLDLFNVTDLGDLTTDDIAQALGFNDTDALLDTDLVDLLDVDAVANITGDTELTLEGGTVSLVDGVLVVEDVVIAVGDPDDGLTVELGNVTLDLDDGVLVVDGGTVDLDGVELFELPEFEIDATQFLPNETVTTLLELENADGITVLHNSSSPHAVAAFAADHVRAQFRWLSGDSEADYTVSNYPLPLTSRQSLELQTILSFFAAIFLLIPFCWVPAAAAVFVVKERVSMAKHQQLVSGVHPTIYWLSAYVWDSCMYIFLLLWCFVVFAAYDLPAFTGTVTQLAATFLLLLLYGLAAIPVSHCLGFAFETPASSQIGVMVFGFVAGFVAVIGIYIMESLEDTVAIAEALEPFFYIFPQYQLGDAMIALSTDYFLELYLNEGEGAFAWDVCGRALVFLACEAVCYFALCLVLEHGGARTISLWRSQRADRALAAKGQGRNAAQADEDEDVRAERERVARGGARDDLVVMEGLRKVYPSRGGGAKLAVERLSLGVPPSECFGFLGINGAGKTSSMQMLTGATLPTAGSAAIKGYDVVSRLSEVRRHIGYCPQFDPLNELMTVRETLLMYSQLKRIPAHRVATVVAVLMRDVGLARYANRRSGALSGGNKRKLSLAIALIGNPAVVFLDEPSTGMDPVARRSMWEVIERYSVGRAILLTSHSMEEVEALCSRIGIMVDGRFRCLGSQQHLKNRFGGGYIMEVKAASLAAGEAVQEFVHATFEGVQLEEFHGSHFKFSMPPQKMHLGAIFGCIEERREQLEIEYYGIGGTSLENLFIRMVKSATGGESSGGVPREVTI